MKIDMQTFDAHYKIGVLWQNLQHKEFIKMLKNFRKRHNSFFQNAVDKLLASIKEWILYHILENDKKLGDEG